MKRKYLILLFTFSMALVSCRTPRFVYSPAPPNNPYFKTKGESRLAGYYSTGGDDNKLTGEYANGLDLQAAFALSNHWALTADYFKRNEKDIFNDYNRRHFDSSVIRYNRNLTNFGAGYFIPVTKDQRIFMNLFGGTGFGKFSFTDKGIDSIRMNYSRNYNSNTTKWYIQPSINFFPADNFRTGLTGKLSYVHYGNASTNYTSGELTYLNLDRLPGSTLSFFEVTWNIQVTAPKLEWLYLDGGFTISSEPFDNRTNLEARNFNVSIGLNVDFSKIKRR